MVKLGKDLERLVREVEETLLPEGFSVSANEHAFGDEGNQLAEFDIQITGNLGSTFIKWLIECRDRPSQGAAPGSWIEQLVGRRHRFGFNKVTAVSTTGFAKGAEKYAREEGIELRIVEQLTADSITDWLLISELDVTKYLGTLHHAELIPDDSEVEQSIIESLRTYIRKAKAEHKILTDKRNGRMVSMSAAWQEIINTNRQFFDGLVPNGPTRQAKIRVNYTNPAKRYQVSTDEGPIDIVQIVFRAELSIVYNKVPVSKITQYSKALKQEVIAQSAHFEIEAGDKTIDLTLRNFGKKDKTLVSVRLASQQ